MSASAGQSSPTMVDPMKGNNPAVPSQDQAMGEESEVERKQRLKLNDEDAMEGVIYPIRKVRRGIQTWTRVYERRCLAETLTYIQIS